MVKWWIFSLSLLLLVGCGLPPSTDLAQLSRAERDQRAAAYEGQAGQWYQGSIYRERMFDSLQAIAPWQERYYREQSVPLTKIGDYHRAFPLLEKAAELDPEEALYYYSWLLLYYYRDYPRALHYLKAYDDLYPGQMQYAWGENVNFLKGLAYKGLGQLDSAILEFSTAIEQEGPTSTDVYTFVYRGICYLKKKQLALAISDFDFAMETYPRCAMAYTYRAIAHYLDGKQEQAQADLEQAAALIRAGYKKEDPYIHVFNETYLELVADIEFAFQHGGDLLGFVE